MSVSPIQNQRAGLIRLDEAAGREFSELKPVVAALLVSGEPATAEEIADTVCVIWPKPVGFSPREVEALLSRFAGADGGARLPIFRTVRRGRRSAWTFTPFFRGLLSQGGGLSDTARAN